MKTFFVLFFYLSGPTASVYSFLGNLPPHPWFFTTQMKRLQPRHMTIIPRLTSRQDISKFIYWKHLLELECFKEICGQVHFKDRSGYKRPFEMIGHRQMPALRNDGTGHRDQVPNFYKVKENQIESDQQSKKKHPGNERIILWSPERNFTQKQPDVSPTKKEFDRGKAEKEGLRGNPKETALVKDVIHQKTHQGLLPPIFQGRTAEEKSAFENPGALLPEEGDPDGDAMPELFQNTGVMRSSTAKYPEDIPHGYRHRVSPSRIQPYEVEEIIEEKFTVDTGDKDEDGFRPFPGKDVSRKDNSEMSKLEIKKKTEHFQKVIDHSVNTILKGLINPVMKTALSPQRDVMEPAKKPPGVTPSTKSEAFKTFTSHPFSEKANENIFGTPFRQQQTYSKPRKIQPTEGHYSWGQQTADPPQNFARKSFRPDTRSRGFDLNPSLDTEYINSFLPTDSSKRPAVTEAYDESSFDIFNAEDFQSDLTNDLGRKPGSKISDLPPTETVRSMDLLRNLLANFQPDFAPTEETTATVQKAPETSTNPTTSHSLPSEIPKEFFPNTTDSKDSTFFSEAATALATEDFMETVKYFSDAKVGDVAETEHNFLEFSDRPMSFDLLTTTIRLDSKKDQETIWKNSRRMHFGHEPRRTTVPSRILGTAETEQRRSDILITDTLADYVDDENNLSTLGYFEKLKQNDFPHDPNNLTSDGLVPFIPVIINDLREGRIPAEDIPILSRALGKYWNPIRALANFTNLDMLPLIKMKDEKDLENVLQNFLPEDGTSTTAGTTEGDYRMQDDYSQSYDYMDEYRDLYKDILGQELGDKKRRFRSRRDAEDDLKALEATREYFDSLEEERSDEESDYIFEDIIYDEVSDGEGARIFELMEVSDVHFDKET